jgi:hypothetical protein
MLKHNTFSLPFLVLKAEGMGPVIKSLKESLQENGGPKRPKENKDWFTEKYKRGLEERNQARLMLLNRQTHEHQKRYESPSKTPK